MASTRPLPPRDRAIDDDADLPEPPRLRALRRLVTALTATLILGVVTIAGAMVLRITATPPAPAIAGFDPATVSADALALPPGETVTAAGAAGPALMLVTRSDDGTERLHLFDVETGARLRSLAITRTTP